MARRDKPSRKKKAQSKKRKKREELNDVLQRLSPEARQIWDEQLAPLAEIVFEPAADGTRANPADAAKLLTDNALIKSLWELDFSVNRWMSGIS